MTSRIPWPYALGDAESFLADPRPEGGLFCLILSHEGRDGGAPALVGGIGVRPAERGDELGYWLTPDAWGRGYATEAGRAVLGMARHALGCRRLVASHYVDNPASGRVLRKLGFRPTGRTEQQHSVARGAVGEVALFELDLVDDSRLCPDDRLAA
jgi:RimJ/RimL family protein N-acetyltransferase